MYNWRIGLNTGEADSDTDKFKRRYEKNIETPSFKFLKVIYFDLRLNIYPLSLQIEELKGVEEYTVPDSVLSLWFYSFLQCKLSIAFIISYSKCQYLGLFPCLMGKNLLSEIFEQNNPYGIFLLYLQRLVYSIVLMS